MAWEILSGVVEWWADEGLRELGRRRASERAEREPSRALIELGSIQMVRVAFIAQRDPWRLAEITLVETSETPTAPEIAAWADDATAVLSGMPVAQHVVAADESWGDNCLRAMLLPSALHRIVPTPWAERFEIKGMLLEQDADLLPELVSVSIDQYEVRFDPELEILTEWTAILDHQAAQRITVSQLTQIDR